jgi:TorA maturation chaperone TorD
MPTAAPAILQGQKCLKLKGAFMTSAVTKSSLSGSLLKDFPKDEALVVPIAVEVFHRVMNDPKTQCCSLSLQLFEKPVMDQAGNTYEEALIRQHFARLKEKGQPLFSPLTNEALEGDVLVPNKQKKSEVESYKNDTARECISLAALCIGKNCGETAQALTSRACMLNPFHPDLIATQRLAREAFLTHEKRITEYCRRAEAELAAEKPGVVVELLKSFVEPIVFSYELVLSSKPPILRSKWCGTTLDQRYFIVYRLVDKFYEVWDSQRWEKIDTICPPTSHREGIFGFEALKSCADIQPAGNVFILHNKAIYDPDKKTCTKVAESPLVGVLAKGYLCLREEAKESKPYDNIVFNLNYHGFPPSTSKASLLSEKVYSSESHYHYVNPYSPIVTGRYEGRTVTASIKVAGKTVSTVTSCNWHDSKKVTTEEASYLIDDTSSSTPKLVKVPKNLKPCLSRYHWTISDKALTVFNETGLPFKPIPLSKIFNLICNHQTVYSLEDKKIVRINIHSNMEPLYAVTFPKAVETVFSALRQPTASVSFAGEQTYPYFELPLFSYSWPVRAKSTASSPTPIAYFDDKSLLVREKLEEFRGVHFEEEKLTRYEVKKIYIKPKEASYPRMLGLLFRAAIKTEDVETCFQVLEQLVLFSTDRKDWKNLELLMKQCAPVPEKLKNGLLDKLKSAQASKDSLLESRTCLYLGLLAASLGTKISYYQQAALIDLEDALAKQALEEVQRLGDPVDHLSSHLRAIIQLVPKEEHARLSALFQTMSEELGGGAAPKTSSLPSIPASALAIPKATSLTSSATPISRLAGPSYFDAKKDH